MSSLVDRVLELTIAIQQIPAPTFAEEARAAFVQGRFVENGLQNVAADPIGNVFARLPGIGSASPVVLSAHLDTVFPLETDLAVRRGKEKVYGAGIGDNSLGVAGLFGLIWSLEQRRIKLPGDLWLVANVGEEGLGDLRGMKEVVRRFGSRVRAYLVLEGAALGHIYHRALSVQRYRVSAHTAGGHSWVNYGAPSAVHEIAALVTRLAELSMPAEPRSSLNVGILSGGTSVNTIAADAYFELDLRSETMPGLQALDERVKGVILEAEKPGVGFDVLPTSHRPGGSIPDSHLLVRLAARCLNEVGQQPVLTIGSTDANIPLSQGYPAICVGLTTGGGTHTQGEFIEVDPIGLGLQQLTALVEGVYKL